MFRTLHRDEPSQDSRPEGRSAWTLRVFLLTQGKLVHPCGQYHRFIVRVHFDISESAVKEKAGLKCVRVPSLVSSRFVFLGIRMGVHGVSSF